MKSQLVMQQLKSRKEYIDNLILYLKEVENFEQRSSYKDFLQKQYQAVYKQKLRKITQIDLDQLYLCHATSFFPGKGIIIPRVNYRINLPESHKRLSEVLGCALSNVRPTVHFCINNVYAEHSEYGGLENKNFVILEKLKNAKGKVIGGYLEDMFALGSYQLSPEASILIPEHYKKDPLIQSKIKHLPEGVTITYYHQGTQQAVHEWLQAKNLPYLESTGILNSVDEPLFVGKLGKKYIESSELAKSLGIRFITHDITPMAAIEDMLLSKILLDKPYLEILMSLSLQETFTFLKLLTQKTAKVFKLNEDQKAFLNIYEVMLRRIISLCKESTSLDMLGNKWELEAEELIMNYDSEVALNKPVAHHTLALNLSRATGLQFKSYFRTNCQTIVDAACQVDSEEAMKKYIHQLNTIFGEYFSPERHGKCHYIVLREINEPFIAAALNKTLSQTIQISFHKEGARGL